jgi:glycosyltransferase involved in cell wall biosynthesis
MRPLLIDGRPLQGGSSVRGIGTYVRGLLAGLDEIGLARQVALLLNRSTLPIEVAAHGLGVGPRIPDLHRRLQPLVDPKLIGSALARHRPALYHATEWGQPSAAEIPVVVTVHDLIPFVLPGYPWKSRERLRLAVRLLRRADRLVVPSRATADDCVAVAGCDPDRIRVVPHGIDPVFRPAPPAEVTRVRRRYGLSRGYLFTAGTFEPHKRPELLAAVAARLRAHEEIDLVISGDQGIFGDRLRHQLERAGLGAHAHVLGHVPLEDLVALYSGCAAAIMTSRYEGFGLPVLEAMACGAPVAVFATASLPEVAGTAGLVVADGDANAMVAALASVLASPRLHEQRREAGIARAAEFTWARAAEATAAVYAELTPAIAIPPRGTPATASPPPPG